VTGVAAIVIGSGAEAHAGLRGEHVAEVASVSSLADIAVAARDLEAPVVWLLDSGATPAPNCLASLLDSGHEPAVSLPVDPNGVPEEALLGRFTETDLPALLEAAGERRLPLRHTHVVSMVLARSRLIEMPPPDVQRFGRYAGPEWTQRLFARSRGMLVPRSRVSVGRYQLGSPFEALRLARAGGWAAGETLRELHRSVKR
jgi:hypothetical protein